MSKGAKYLVGQLAAEKQENNRLRLQLHKSNERVLLLESKLLGVDFSLKNWWKQKVKKERTTNILNYEPTIIRKDQRKKD